MEKPYDFSLPKESYVQAIFNSIAAKYDLMNWIMSFGIHQLWCKQLPKLINIPHDGMILDACCGTGSVTLELARKVEPGIRIIGLDFSKAMLGIAKSRLNNYISINKIKLIQADASAIPFPDNSFDCVTIAYGLRNSADQKALLKELKRVTKPGGQVISLELVKPVSVILRSFFNVYLHYWVPCLGKILVHDREAYQYLHDSVFSFIDQYQLAAMFKEIGFLQIRCFQLTLGIAAIHIGVKPFPLYASVPLHARK
jgi:demethylmenaquinone methyltransferase/2-methoxy-6-polyprenyl-1,4-benzoquinol methylase